MDSLMPYVNLDDEFAEHPKNDALSDAAFRLHVAGILYCAKHLTDGLIPKAKVRRLTDTCTPKVIAELVAVGQWYDRDVCYEIHDYLVWNKPKEWWEERRRKETERKAKWRAERLAEQGLSE
jgi:hypothetical protein